LTAVSGPIARTVEDVALGYEAMSQPGIIDPWWVPGAKNSGGFNKVAALCTHPDGLETAPEIVSALNTSAEHLVEAGWTVIETACPPMREPMNLQLQLWTSEFHLDQGAAFKAENDPDANFVFQQLHDLFAPPTLESFMGILQKRVSLIRAWERFLGDYPILLCPVSAELPFSDQLDVQSPTAFNKILEAQMTQIALPFISVPAMTVTTGNIAATPIGVQLVAGRYREDILFKAAEEIEMRCEAVGIAEPDWSSA